MKRNLWDIRATISRLSQDYLKTVPRQQITEAAGADHMEYSKQPASDKGYLIMGK